MRVCIRDERRTGEHDWYDAGFQLDDPGKVICTDNKKYDHSRIDDFTVACSVTWPLNGSEAGGDLALIQTSLVL